MLSNNIQLYKISQNIWKSVKLLHIVKIYPVKNGLSCRNSSNTNLQKQIVLSTSCLKERRTFGTKHKGDLDVNNLERVYYGSLAPRMKLVKIFSLTTSLLGLGAQPMLLEQGLKISGTGMAIFMCTFAGFFTFVTPLLLHFITKKYVTEIHYNPVTGEYVATTINIILRKIQTKFRPCDVKVPEVPGMFTSFIVGKKSLFVDPALFENPEHYVTIMGYDKPIDFKLTLKENINPTTNELNKSK